MLAPVEVIGCAAGGNARVTTAAIPAAPPYGTTPEAAASKLTHARCDRALDCGLVGEGRLYRTYDRCAQLNAPDAAESLPDTACHGGIDPFELSGCLREIHDDGCQEPMWSLGQFEACSAARLCM